MPATSRVREFLILLCDECGADVSITDDAELPGNWRKVYLRGWFGAMHACSGACEAGIRKQYEKKEAPACV